MINLFFDQGTIVLHGPQKLTIFNDPPQLTPPGFVWDPRIEGWRSEGYRYRDTILWLRRRNIPFIDQARQYDARGLALELVTLLNLFDYQEQALAAWQRSEQLGVVVLPTGSGKTVVALKAISLRRSSLYRRSISSTNGTTGSPTPSELRSASLDRESVTSKM